MVKKNKIRVVSRKVRKTARNVGFSVEHKRLMTKYNNAMKSRLKTRYAYYASKWSRGEKA